MAFARTYTTNEANFMLQVYEGAKAYRGRNDANTKYVRHGAEAHSSLHGGASFAAQRGRVNTPGSPRTTGTFLTRHDQAQALTEALNSAIGQAALRQLDNNPAQRELRFTVQLTMGRYRMSTHHDNSDVRDVTGTPQPALGHLGRNDPRRVGAGSTRTIAPAEQMFVFAMRQPGGKLMIQTCFPM